MKKLFFLIGFIVLAPLAGTFAQGIPEKDNSVEDKINGVFEPLVEVLGAVFFFDPFAAMGLYDPVIYDDQVPYLPSEKMLPGKVTVIGNRLIGFESDFKPEDVGAQWIVGSEVFTIDKVEGSKDAILDRKAKTPLFSKDYGPVSKTKIPLVVVWLSFGAVFFTLIFRFINFRKVGHAIALLQGKFDKPGEKGEVSHFQALTTALSATVGLGNIASVAVAISVGGPGATFWMIVVGFLGMSLKFVECTLGVKYRKIHADGTISGGPMYYLKEGLAKRGMKGLGAVLAVFFAVLCVLATVGGGCMFQSNQAFDQFQGYIPLLQGHGFSFGLVLLVLVAIVILGGIKSIARVTEKIVPFMAALYVLAALVVLMYHFTDIPSAFSLILEGAFSPDALKGGFIGVLIVGAQRASFSNEAGMGSAAIAHSAAKTDEPVSEGVVALLEPFIDTVVICTITALVIIITGYYDDQTGLEGARLTSAAFGSVITWFPYVLIVAIFLFAYSTMISWFYYGLKAWTFLFGEKKIIDASFKILFLGCILVGTSSSLGAVLDFSDMAILSMAIPNIIGLFIMTPEVLQDTKTYFQKVSRLGNKNA